MKKHIIEIVFIFVSIANPALGDSPAWVPQAAGWDDAARNGSGW